MQSVIVPPSAFPSTEFGHPTFGPTERLPLDLGRSVLARGCSPRALPPPRSMCPNPAGDSSETSEESRRHAEPPRVATTTTGPFEPAITSAPAVAETREPTLGRLVSSSSSDLSQRPFIANDLLPRLPSVFSGQGTAQPVEPSLSTSALVSPPGTTTRPLIQRSTRRTKAHVASACVNCKKKHLGCDSSRPCRRCVLAGKAATCVDVTHKKRGRPPLKAEEASLRPFTAQLENPTSSVAPPRSPQTGRASLHRATSSRELRPTTDLQFPGGGMAIPTGQPQRWTAVHPRAMGPSMPGTFSPRRFSVSGSPQQMAPGLVPMTAGFKPGLNPGRAPPPLQGSPTLPLVTSNSQYYQTFGPPITPYPGSPRTADRPMGPSIPRGSQEATSSGSPVRLPPIFSPTYTTGPLGHRLSDPYPTPWSLRSQDPGQRQQRPPSQGVAELVSPRTQFHPPVPQSHVGYTEPPSQPASMPSAERHPVQLPPTCPRDEHPNGEGEGDGEQRPKKRRKMALDDMVND